YEGDYDGSKLAARGAVIVTLNYRLGAFGFLGDRALAESGHGSGGDFGLLDQIEALRWVQREIASFGGDAAGVMLFGQSAGAVDACVLVASPLAAGLFSRVLLESGPCLTYTTSDASSFAATFEKAMGCSGSTAASCLRSKDAATVARGPGGGIP